MEDSTQKKYSSSGLGMANSKSIAEEHKGKIDLISQIDEGTTFFFDIPIKYEKKLSSSNAA